MFFEFQNNLLNNGDGVDIEQLKFCINICKNKLGKNKETSSTSNFISGSSKKLDNYKNIQTVNKLPMSEITELLKKKCMCSNKRSHKSDLQTTNLIVADYINAFCHPDIIVKVREKLLNKE